MTIPVPPDVLTDRALVGRLWPLLLAAASSLLPFTVLGTYLVAIAADGGWTVAEVGSLRGLGGVAALVVGVAAAPMLDRVSRPRAAALALGGLAVAAVLGTAPWLPAVAAFCLLVGAATSVLNPALAAMAADAVDDREDGGASAGRAATLVSATTSLTALLAAPLVAAPSLLWGWRATLVAVAVLSTACAALVARTPSVPSAGSSPAARGGRRAALTDPAVAALLAVSLLRTTAFMGWLAYVAALYAERFDLGPEVFAAVWTLSGGAFFLGNLLAGRHLARVTAPARAALAAAAGCTIATGALALLVAAPTLPVALAGTAVLAAAHAVVAACVTTLLVRRAAGRRGTVLGLNAAAQSLGVFTGAALGGLGLAWAGWPGAGWLLGGASALAVVLSLAARRAL